MRDWKDLLSMERLILGNEADNYINLVLQKTVVEERVMKSK
jgi:hypothetical protein